MNRDVLSIILFAEIPQLFGKKKYNIVDKKIYLLTEREGWTGKYLKQGYAVQTKNQLFPFQTQQTHSIRILSYNY